MPNAGKYLLAVGLLVGLFAVPVRAHAAASGGLTLTPATLSLSLGVDSAQQSAGFSLTNHYSQPITLHFAFEPQTGAQDTKATEFLQIGYTDLTILANESASQTVTLYDNQQLGPGSHAVDLVITQFGDRSANVTVRPSIRMPLVIIKEDGAVSALALASVSTPKFSLLLPGALTATIHSTGNVVAIPHGFISITAPNGTVVARGVLNTASQAVSPNGKLALDTPMTKLANAWLPGVYRTTVSYGLGGGQTPTVANSRFVYVAWWHVLVLGVVSAAIYYRKKLLLLLKVQKKQTLIRGSV